MRKFKKKHILKLILICFIFFIIVEIYLRVYWGFCDNVLMMYSPHYEYIEQPNQNRFRFRDHIYYNKYSMRSPEVDSSALIILGCGDSVINGGVMVDQDSLATTLLSEELTDKLRTKVQVLNIGAGSWGPDNDYAYLQEKGNFNAKLIFLVVSSHDAHDDMDFTPVIDKVNRYESKQYKLATVELLEKYIIPRIFEGKEKEEISIFKKGKVFNTGFLNFYKYCKEKNIPFFIYLHPDKNELATQNYDPEGHQIIAFCKEYNIPCIQSLHSIKPEDYRGVIHMNHLGQRQMAKDMLPEILSMINQKDSLQ